MLLQWNVLLTYFQVLLVHRIVFVPRDAPKPVPLLGPGIGLIVVIVRIPGGTNKNKNTILEIIAREKKRIVGRQIYFPLILFVYKSPFVF